MPELNLYNQDCMEAMKDMQDNEFDLAIVDPPYNIGKADWDKIPDYIEWLGSVLLEAQRVLKENGSMYLFHNDFLQMIEIQNYINQNIDYRFKQLIVWNKKFNGAKNEGFLQGCNEVGMLRNYQKMAEYILYYTFQDETGLTTVMLDTNNFSTLRKYFKDYQEDVGLNKKQIMDLVGQKADHCFRWGSSQWDLPTKETYTELLKLPQLSGFLRRDYESLRLDYESLRLDYESLRLDYEDLRYTFNNQKSHHSVWNYEVESCSWHPTPKPRELIKNILLYSSNEGDNILDPFAGTGVVKSACEELNRNYTGYEIDENYYNKIINKQLKLCLI